MSKSNIGDLIIGSFYFTSVCIGFVCSKPKLAFYLSVCLALGACVVLFYLRIYVEMAGLFRHASVCDHSVVHFQVSATT